MNPVQEGTDQAEQAESAANQNRANQRPTDNGRQRFVADELAIVLSHYDLGVIESIKAYSRGSRKAPKVIIKSDSGRYLLKRRATGKDDPYKVAFCHDLQLNLADRGFPIAPLLGTKTDNNSILQLNGHIYEMFEFVIGENYDSSLNATSEAGRTLALFHRLLREFAPRFDSSRGSYHHSQSVTQSMLEIPQVIAETEPGTESTVAAAVEFLREAYHAAAEHVNSLGIADWPAQIVHCDWHPGNMLYRGQRVIAVLDFDAARVQQPIIDIANGALQFSMIGGGEDASKWPEYIDQPRFKRFLQAYESMPDCVLSRAEVHSVPWLMIQALIAESVIPIAATGSFAQIQGSGFLTMVQRKVVWLQQHAQELIEISEN